MIGILIFNIITLIIILNDFFIDNKIRLVSNDLPAFLELIINTIYKYLNIH